MDLLTLDDLIPNLGIDPTEQHLDELFSNFKRDFIERDLIIDGCKVVVDLRPSKEVGLENYPHTFGKIITRGPKGKRSFDRKRANKIHWIRPILENKNSEDVTCFQFLEADGAIREYFWFKEGCFIVIMEKIKPDYIIVSCFHIDDDRNQKYYNSRYTNRIK